MLAGILAVVHPACRVVLIGDPHQLLSVGPGNVLPDLLALGVPHIRLSSYHRQADGDSALAYNVREFGSCHSVDDLRFDDSFRFIPLTDDTTIRNCVCRGGINLYRLGADIQVLSPFNHSGLLSSASLNVAFRECLNPATEENTIKDVFFRAGDRVIIQQNDWEQKVCNGDIGTYYHKSADGVLYYSVACNRDRVAVWGGEGANPLYRLKLAYVITIHKAQGSEYDTIVLPISKGFTQEKLAEFADLSVLYISHLERGTKTPSLAVLVRLADSLDVTVDRLLSGNQTTDKSAYYQEVQELLEDCSVLERVVLTEIIGAAKRSIRAHGMSRPL